ncbi:MAG: hypothetical protein DI533_00310 [Cereibacter sphaeroides]|uniref:Lipoprotein n=1 Tax=Cereibacter sphaeroides TaxID=1063 RepID=A0A2W5SIP9_CERSP|nr:MAG: hypothetical protein DI533_00310 [Cereibacter sphaeroides]
MLKRLGLTLCALWLAGCVEPKTPEGCPVMLSEYGQAYTRACQQAYYEGMARQTGGTVTKCFPSSGGAMTCVTN